MILEAIQKPKFFVSFGGKINLGNYESQDINFGVSNIPVDCSGEYLQEVMNAAISRQRITVEGFAAEFARMLKEDFGR